MSKSNWYTIANSSFFLISFVVFWMELTVLYENPMIAISFDPADLSQILIIASTIAFICLPMILLLVVRTEIKLRYLLYTIASISSFFFMGTPVIAVILTLGTFLALYLFDHSTLKELRNQVTFKPHNIMKRAISGFLTTMAIFISLAYYASASSQVHLFKIQIPDQLFNQVINAVSSQMNPGQPKDKSEINKLTDQLFETQVKPNVLQQLESAGISAPEDVQKYLDQARTELETKAAQQVTSLSLKPDATLYAEVKKQAQGNIDAIVQKYQKFLPALFSFSLFALFQFMDIFVSLGVSGLLFLILAIMKATGLVHITSRTENVEVLSL